MKRLLIALVIFILFVASFATIKYLSSRDTPVVPIVTNNSTEKFDVETYVRTNLKSIIPENAVLGGTWYLLSIHIDTTSKKGEMVYEDGHIQGSAIFDYSINGTQIALQNIRKVK